MVGIAPPALAASFTMPPITDRASQERHPGKVVFVQLVTPDLAGAEQFYGGLFGWTFQDVPGTRSPYAVASLAGMPVAGIAQHAMESGGHGRPAWLSYFSVPDVAAAVGNATAQGAKVLAPEHMIPGRGDEAVLADPQGAVFGVLASSSGDPPDVLSPVGDWIWRSLMAGDPVADVAFYHTLFGFESFALPSPAGEQHLLLASENFARATANSFPASSPTAHPHWLNFVRVDDAAQAAAKAASLGGRVLVAPRPDRHGGKIAVVADPQGAAVGLFEWGETESKEIAK